MLVWLVKHALLVRKTLATSDTPRMLALGVAFGLLLGFIPKGNLLALSLSMIVLASRVNINAAMLTALVVSFISPLADPISHRVGLFLLTPKFAEPMWNWIFSFRAMLWTSLNNTVVLGSLTLGTIFFYATYRLSLRVFERHAQPNPADQSASSETARAIPADPANETPKEPGPTEAAAHAVDSSADTDSTPTTVTDESQTAGTNPIPSAAGDDVTPPKNTEDKPQPKPSLVRWGYVIPRLAIVATVLLFLTYGVDPFIRGGLVQAGQSVTGARVDVGNVVSAVGHGAVLISDVAIADPNEPLKNLGQFDQLALQVEMPSLFDRRIVVTHGRLTGLRFNADREMSGRLDVEPPETVAEEPASTGAWQASLNRASEQWFDDLTTRLTSDTIDRFQTVRVAKELSARWPGEYDRLRQRIGVWKSEVYAFQQRVKEIRQDPLRGLRSAADHVQKVRELRQELADMRSEIGRLAGQYRTDRVAISEARQHDQQQVRDLLQFDNLNGKDLAAYLLGEELNGYVTTTLKALRTCRDVLRIAGEAPKPNLKLGRGVDIQFAERQPQPRLVVQSLFLDGEAKLGDQPYRLSGHLTDLTSNAKSWNRPTQLVLKVAGPTSFNAKFTVDRRSDERTEHFVFNCPRFVRDKRELGNPKKLAVEVGAGEAAVWAEFRFRGDEVSGQLIWNQEEVSLDIATGNDGAGTDAAGTDAAERTDDAEQQVAAATLLALTDSLRETVSEVERIGVVVVMEGPLKSPRIRYESNLGTQLAHGFNKTVRRQLIVRREQVQQAAQRYVASHMSKLDEFVQSSQASMLGELVEGDKLLSQAGSWLGGWRDRLTVLQR